MAPDKIYIAEHNANVQTGYFSRNRDDIFTQEYIHKDALMELMKGYSHPLTKIVVRELIDKINSL